MPQSRAAARQCFVGYSYGLYPDARFRATFERVSSQTGVGFVFADTKLTNEHILEKITRMIHEADFSVFDISDWNPNVSLELGIAREAGKPWYITIDPSKSTGGIREAPADLRGFDRIQYTNFDELEKGLLRLLKQNSTGPPPPIVRAANPGYYSIFDGTVSIAPYSHHAISVDLPKGAKMSIFARELQRQSFDLYVMDRRNYARFCRDRSDTDWYSSLDEDVVEFERSLPRDGGWYVVLDASQKRIERSVSIQIKRRIVSP